MVWKKNIIFALRYLTFLCSIDKINETCSGRVKSEDRSVWRPGEGEWLAGKIRYKNFVITFTAYDWFRINLKKIGSDGKRCLPNVERRSRELGRHIIIVVVRFAHLQHDKTTTTRTGRILQNVKEHGLDDTELKRCVRLGTVSPRRGDEMTRLRGRARRKNGRKPTPEQQDSQQCESRDCTQDDKQHVVPEQYGTDPPAGGVGGVCPRCSDTRGAGKRTCNQEENIPENT